MSELCLEGQRNNAAVYKRNNLLEIVKKTKLKKQLAHLDHVERERNLYKAIVSERKTTVQANAAVKCALFGMIMEGIPQQVNYLIHEGMTIS